MSIDWNNAKLKTETLVPWITVAGLALGAGYALIEYRDQQHDKRVERSMDYVQRFMESPISDHRAMIAKSWQAYKTDLLAVLNNKSLSTTEASRAYSAKILAMVSADELALPIQELVYFFEQLANCVTLKLCDSDAVNSMLATQAAEFLHQYFPYICHLRVEWNDPSIAVQIEKMFNPGSVGKNYCW